MDSQKLLHLLNDQAHIKPAKASMAKAAKRVAAQPYVWPFDGDLRPENTALLAIDMQTDFCGKGGYVETWLSSSVHLKTSLK